MTDGIDSSVGCSRISTLVVPSEFPETAPYEALREVCRRQIDMQFADLHVALQLPAASIDPDVGLNLTTAALLFSLVAGASVILHEPSWKAFKSGAASGSRFKAALEHAYPWRPDDEVSGAAAAELLYKWARNPLVHSLGIGKDRHAMPGAPGSPPYDRIVFVKWALTPVEVHAVSQGPAGRPPWLPATVTRDGPSIEFSVPTLAWGTHVMWRALITEHGNAAERVARRVLGWAT